MNDDPVFVAGLERSGTSLVFALLATHRDISMTRRTNFWRYFAGQFGDLGDEQQLDACLDKMRRYKRLVGLEIDFDRLRADFLQGPPTDARLYALVQGQVAARRGKSRWGDKSLNIEQYADRVFADFPRATILHVVRDPRDRLASVLARWKHRRGDVGAGTAAWLGSVRLAEGHVRRHPGRYRIVRYESLVRDPQTELREICAFIDEEYDESMLTMAGGGRFHDQGSNSSYGSREQGVIATDSIRKYEQKLSPIQIRFIQDVAGRAMARHGYEPGPVALTGKQWAHYFFWYHPFHRAVMIAWYVQQAYRRRRGETLPDRRLVSNS